MGQPSFQASNAIIYLTYGAFLCARFHFLSRSLRMYSRRKELTAKFPVIQGLGRVCGLVLEASVEVGILGYQSNTKGSDKARAGDGACKRCCTPLLRSASPHTVCRRAWLTTEQQFLLP